MESPFRPPLSPSSPLNSISLSNLRAASSSSHHQQHQHQHQQQQQQQQYYHQSRQGPLISKFDSLPLKPLRISFDTIKSTINGQILNEVSTTTTSSSTTTSTTTSSSSLYNHYDYCYYNR